MLSKKEEVQIPLNKESKKKFCLNRYDEILTYGIIRNNIVDIEPLPTITDKLKNIAKKDTEKVRNICLNTKTI